MPPAVRRTPLALRCPRRNVRPCGLHAQRVCVRAGAPVWGGGGSPPPTASLALLWLLCLFCACLSCGAVALMGGRARVGVHACDVRVWRHAHGQSGPGASVRLRSPSSSTELDSGAWSWPSQSTRPRPAPRAANTNSATKRAHASGGWALTSSPPWAPICRCPGHALAARTRATPIADAAVPACAAQAGVERAGVERGW